MCVCVTVFNFDCSVELGLVHATTFGCQTSVQGRHCGAMSSGQSVDHSLIPELHVVLDTMSPCCFG